jgi:hypothetical protein
LCASAKRTPPERRAYSASGSRSSPTTTVGSAGSVEVTEADIDTTIEVPLTLSEPSSEEVTVDWHTINNSAAAPSGYAAATAPPPSNPVRPDHRAHHPARRQHRRTAQLVVVALSNAQKARVGGWLGLGFAHVTDDD